MNNAITRRTFLKQTSALAVGAASSSLAAVGPNDKVRVAVIGCNGRGMAHIAAWLSLPQAEIAYICDVDSRAMEKGIAAVAKSQSRKPKGVKDLRRVLDDPNIDAVSIAMPDHWHTSAAILACSAGKHVYVEKPGSHNGEESEWIVAAARKHNRKVQMGNQRRSWSWVQEAIQALRAGELGRLYFARGWYTNHRASIGRGKPAAVPEWLDYTLWQGPAPERPYQDNLIHYNWHWFWHWGTGELGNNGVHSLDLARWGLGVDLPRRITCGGNRYHFQDDWQTPDLYVATFDFGDKGIVWEGQSCDPHGFEDAEFGVNFYGENGTMTITSKARIYDLKNKLVREIPGKLDGNLSTDAVHFANFIGAIRNGDTLHSEIEEGQKSTLLCHLGNIAWRTGQTVNFNPETRKIIGNDDAATLWKRTYEPAWQPKV
ncbi:MAG TPA: Gfo/Idh/MocA family oxidoreductase [Verrucomicrobiae bacterium]|jgi:predicted dehydrogenase|nr:Gfo/Idh/MocA family oxidoreductase [Verrucomicrobiae bacterium]